MQQLSIIESSLTKDKSSKVRKWIPWLFVSPHVVIFSIFFLLPAIFGIGISFTKWNLFATPEFVGLDNYRTILFDTNSIFYEQFMSGIANTFIFVLLTVPFCIIVPLLLAATLNAKPRFHKLFQALFYMPSLFAVSAVMLIWGLVFNVDYGLVNNIFGVDISMLSTQPYAWIALVVVTVWWYIGANMIIYQAALSGISKDLYEAADIDGATSVQKFFKITLPSIKSQILYTLVLTTIAQFNVFGQPLMLTKGGPNNSTRVLLMQIQSNAFGSGDSIAGIASAMAVVLGLCIMSVSAIQFKLLKK